MKSLNVLVLEPFELAIVDVDLNSSPEQTKKAIANYLDRPVSKISVYLPPAGIALPDVADSDSIRAVLPDQPMSRWPIYPRKWDLPSLFNAEDDLHLVAVPRADVDMILYETKTGTVRLTTASLMDTVGSIIPRSNSKVATKIYKAPSRITCGTSSQHKEAAATLRSVDLLSLVELNAFDCIFDIHPGGLARGEVHFIVDAPVEDVSEDELGTLPTPADLGARRAIYFRSNPSKSPSSEAKKSQSERIMLIGRPTESILPPSLMDETLCQFRHDIFHVTPAKQDFVDFYVLREGMMKVFPREIDRTTLLIDILGKILPTRPEPGSISSYTNDGQLFVTVLNIPFLYYLQEVKNEVTDTSSEPNIEVAHYYIEQCRRCHQAGIKQHCNFPAILLCQLGPYLVVSVAAFTDIPMVEQVVCIPLHVHSTNSAQIKAGACLVAALRAACHNLHQRYPALIMNKQLQADFPFPRSFHFDNAVVTFSYTAALEDKRVYRALVDETKDPIYVKYTLRYSEAAHNVASELGFAPKLLAMERVQDWYMVVMEDVSEDFTSLAEAKSQGSNVQGIHWQSEVKRALQSLHERGYVHGDVNVLVRKSRHPPENRTSILLVDWDWAGVGGEVTYPYTLNPDVLRPDGAVAGAVIGASHDIGMVDFLLE